MTHWTEHAGSWLSRRPFRLFVLLYAGVAALGAAAAAYAPEPFAGALRALTDGAGLGAMDPAGFGQAGGSVVQPAATLWAIAAVAMTAAGLYALPVAWLYTITRQKRGYRMSVVQSLILLPVVVAGVVVLVKHSLALAFSLAGIVAAVRFRNTLEDSKDAVYIFVATGIGLAAGVELRVALTLSLLFNLVTLLLFRADFGRTPARLEGELAERRMQRALASANRTSQFVAQLDSEVLGQLSPEQLQAVAERAWRRRDAHAAGTEVTGEDQAAPEIKLTVVTDGEMRAREVTEMILGRDAKRWRFVHAEASGGGTKLEYTLRLRKRVPPTLFLDALKAQGAPHVLDVTIA